MTVALYARVSSDRQREEGTIASQLQELRQFAEGEGLFLDERHVYLDEGKSGYYLDRPGLDALRDAARDGLVDLVLMHDPDRLSRKYAYQVLLLEEFKRWHVDIRFLKQPPAESDEQRLLVQIQGVIAEYERARIMERTRRGRLYWARQGHPVCARVPYGHRYVQRDKNQRPSVEVDAEAAEVVRQIFGWYVTDRLSGQQIAQQLTNREIVPPRGGRSYWDPSTVRFILTNEAYLGFWYLNRFRMEPRAEQRRPRVGRRPREEWIAVAIPALIGSEMFLRAQEIRASGCHQGPRPLTHPETHLLRRLVVCGNCNRAMTSLNSTNDGHRYYWCRGVDSHRIMPKRSWCPHPTVSAPELDALVWADVLSLLSDPELLLSAWQEQHQIDTTTNLSEEELRRLKRQISDGKNQCRRLVDAYQKQAIELEELVSRRTAIERRLASIQRTIDELAEGPRERLSFADLERNIDEVCRSLSDRLRGMGMNGKMSLCRDLIDKVVVENGNVEIHYKFPVSSNSNTRRERPSLLLQGLLPLSIVQPEAGTPVRRVPR
jgi:site-specific DNA recombinase